MSIPDGVQGYCAASARWEITSWGAHAFLNVSTGSTTLLDPVSSRVLKASSESVDAVAALVQRLGWQRFAAVAMDTPDARAALGAWNATMHITAATAGTRLVFCPSWIASGAVASVFNSIAASLQASFVRALVMFVDANTWFQVLLNGC